MPVGNPLRGPDVSIGIDLGTRNAPVAFVTPSGTVELIPNRWGSVITPSVVGWEDGQWLVGEDAARLALRSSKNVWRGLKRKVGTAFRVSLAGRDYEAQDLLVPLLTALREDAEVRFHAFVSSCVLAAPAHFSPAQKEALILAANAAGLTEVRIVDEPAAAALSLGREGRFLLLDFGAGAAVLSVVEGGGGAWQVLESLEADGIGGDEFDAALADWLSQRLLLDDLEAMPLLLQEAERIKAALSDRAAFQWTSPLGNRGSLTVEREDVERLIRFPIRRLAHMARRLWERHRPERLFLVGSSSRIPLLREILTQEVTLQLSLGPENAVVRGAALCATAPALPERDTEANERRLRELRLELAALETSLTRAQQDRIHLLFQKAEGILAPEVLRLLEDMTRELRQAVGQ